MSNIDRKYAYHDDGVLPAQGEYGVTYLTLYSSGAGNTYDGWIWDPDRINYSETARTFGYRNPSYPNYCWDDEVVVDLSNPQNREEGSSEFEQGRLTSFNTNVSDKPIILQDIDVTGMTEEERECRATTVLFSAIPLIKDAYIHAEVEVGMKMNISPTNTNGNVRIEAFYILNDESDRTMRPHPINHYTVSTNNEQNLLRLLYWNPALKHEDPNYIGVKLIASGGTAEIGISDDPDYGDAIMTISSAGFRGDNIYDEQPIGLNIYGRTSVPYHYVFDPDDFTVIATFADGTTMDVTRICEFSPEMYTMAISSVDHPTVTLTATFMGLTASLEIAVPFVGYLYMTGNTVIHGSYTLDIEDYTVIAYISAYPGDPNPIQIDVTDECVYTPAMGTTLTENTTLAAEYFEEDGSSKSTSIYIRAQSVRADSGNGTARDIRYTLYKDGYLEITGRVSDSWRLTEDLDQGTRCTAGVGVYERTNQFYYPKYNVTGKPINDLIGATEQNRPWTVATEEGSNGSNIYYPMYMFDVHIPNSMLNYVNKIEYKLKGKPLGMTLFSPGSNSSSISNSKAKNSIELIGFENVDTSKLISMRGCFVGSSASAVRPGDKFSFVNSWDLSNLDDLSFAFACCDISNLSLNCSNIHYACCSFDHAYMDPDHENSNLFSFSTFNNLRLAEHMFRWSNIKSLGFASAWRLPELIDASRMFSNCVNLESIEGAKNWNVSKLILAEFMFEGCSSLTSIIGAFDNWLNSNLLSARCMFHSCTSLTNISGVGRLLQYMANEGDINEGNITGMFRNCRGLTAIPYSFIVPANIKYITGAFYSCTNLSDISAASTWYTSQLGSLRDVFYNDPISSSAPSAIAGWDVSNVKTFELFMNLATDTMSEEDTIHPDPPEYARTTEALVPLRAWNVDSANANTGNAFGRAYADNHSVMILPYVYVIESETYWHRDPAIPWYAYTTPIKNPIVSSFPTLSDSQMFWRIESEG